MNESFSRVERSVILQYMQQELPELQVCKNNEPFLLLPQKSYTIVQENIVFPAPPTENNSASFFAEVSVHFYFNGRGIFFVSPLQYTKNLAGMPISASLFKMPEKNMEYVSEFSGDITFKVSNGSVTIPCISVREFPLFCAETATVPYQKNAEIFPQLLQKYADIEPELRAPICAFLSGGTVKKFAILGRANPLTILYVSEKLIVLGGGGNNFPFKKGFMCTFTGRLGIRTVQTTCATQAVFLQENNHSAVCEFTAIKPEDTRFLYEKLYKTLFS